MPRISFAPLALLTWIAAMTAQAQEAPPPPETISAEARQAVAMMNAMAAAAPASSSIEDWRAQSAQIQDAVAAAQLARYDVSVERSTIAGVPVIIYRPRGGPHRSGVLVNAHGGGFMLDSGSQTENIPLASLTGMTIIAVLYRLAPEHPFPAAVDDVTAVYRDVLRTTPAHQIALFGTSAGAVLSAQTIVRLRQDNQPIPAAVGFFSGSADFARTGDSEQFFPGPGGMTLRQTSAPYIGATADTEPALSPLYGDLTAFPDTLVITSTRDTLLSQSTIFHRALLEAGVSADLVVFEGLPHAFWAYLQTPESDEAFNIMAKFFRTKLSAGAGN